MNESDLAQVEAVLDRAVRPYLNLHNGGVTVTEFGPTGILRVEFTGDCAGCPAADLSMQAVVKEELLTALPGLVSDVVLVEPVSDDLLAQARRLMVRARAHDRQWASCTLMGPTTPVG